MSVSVEHEIEALMAKHQTCALVGFYMWRESLDYPHALKHYHEHLHEAPPQEDDEGTDDWVEQLHKYIVHTALATHDDIIEPEVELLLRITGEEEFDILTDTDKKTFLRVGIFIKMADARKEIQILMNKYHTCPLIAYYMWRDGDEEYDTALAKYQQHNHYVSLIKQEELREEVGYDPDDDDESEEEHEKKRHAYILKLVHAQCGLTNAETDLLLTIDYDGKNFNIPTSEEVKAAFPNISSRETASLMFMYGWTEQQATGHKRRLFAEYLEEKRHAEALEAIKKM